MKTILPLLACLLALPLASCIESTRGDGLGTTRSESKAFEQGFGFGSKDARQGRQSNPLLYDPYYTAATKDEFIRGYRAGYRKGGQGMQGNRGMQGDRGMQGPQGTQGTP